MSTKYFFEKHFLIAFITIAVYSTNNCPAQYFNRTNFPVVENSVSLANAWAGGLDNCISSEIDLDMDGKNDLLFFDVKSNKMSPFLNVGTNGNIAYTYAPQFITKFPPIKDWVICKDYIAMVKPARALIGVNAANSAGTSGNAKAARHMGRNHK